MMISAPIPEQTQMTKSTISAVRPMGAVSASVTDADGADADDDGEDIVDQQHQRDAQLTRRGMPSLSREVTSLTAGPIGSADK
jgi:hypothetical protein